MIVRRVFTPLPWSMSAAADANSSVTSDPPAMKSAWTALVTKRVPSIDRMWSASRRLHMAPAGVPNDVLAKLNGAVKTALKNPELIAAFAKVGVEPRGSSPEEGAQFIKTEYAKWKDVIQSANIKLN